MFGIYLRLVLFLAGLVGAVILFAFAFTAAAIVVAVVILLLALFGRRPDVRWTIVRPGRARDAGEPLIIDHDPNALSRHKDWRHKD